jgi:hypothetical protein
MIRLIEVVGAFELSHHQLAQHPGQLLGVCGIVLGKQNRGRGQVGVPIVPADRGEEGVQLADPVSVRACAESFGVKIGEMAFHQPGLTTPTYMWPEERRWAPDRLPIDFERRLTTVTPPKMLVPPNTHLDAFLWEDDRPTGSFYLGNVSYYLLGPEENFNARPSRLLNELNRIFREGPWPKEWRDQ